MEETKSTDIPVESQELGGKETAQKVESPNDLSALFSSIIARMPRTFDSHDFILALLKEDPACYFSLYRLCQESVPLTNAYISNYLVNNSGAINIVFISKTMSPDIFQNISECAQFKKK